MFVSHSRSVHRLGKGLRLEDAQSRLEVERHEAYPHKLVKIDLGTAQSTSLITHFCKLMQMLQKNLACQSSCVQSTLGAWCTVRVP